MQSELRTKANANVPGTTRRLMSVVQGLDVGTVGATLSDDVHPYEAMKRQMLNGGHQIVAISGELLGPKTIDNAMAHALIRQFLKKTAREEIAPHVDAVPGMSPYNCIDSIVRRFSNPRIKDTTHRSAFDVL